MLCIQGAEGICWLLVEDAAKIQGGEFYLDRSPQPKHLSGPFFSEGSYTKNTPKVTQGWGGRRPATGQGAGGEERGEHRAEENEGAGGTLPGAFCSALCDKGRLIFMGFPLILAS